jgi:hypothetical protein
MTRWFGSGLVVIPNLFRDLGFGFKVFLLKPRPVGGVLYSSFLGKDLGFLCKSFPLFVFEN